MRAKLAISLGLLLAIGLAFHGVAELDFLAWDDDDYVTNNAHVRAGLTAEGLDWALTTRAEGNWHPVTWLSHMLDVELFGLDARAHHLANLALHAANTLLLFFLLARATGAVWASAFVAGVFALHPSRVESVAWISERKDLLSAAMLLGCLHGYTAWVQRGSRWGYGLAAVALAIGLACKSMLMTAPALLLLLDVWPFGRTALYPSGDPVRPRRLLLEKLPFAALAFAAAVAAVATQGARGTLWSLELLPLGARLANACVAWARQLGHALWPVDLVAFYPLPPEWPVWWVAGSAGLLIAISALTLLRVRREPWLAVGWFWFVGMLLPTVGLVHFGRQAMADRYTYFPLIGLAVALTWTARKFLSDRAHARASATAVAALVLVACGIGTARYVPVWRDTLTLFSHTLQHTQQNPVAEHTVGIALARRSRHAEALQHYDTALSLEPRDAAVHHHRAQALLALGRQAEARAALERAVELDPAELDTRQALGVLLEAQGEPAAALALYRDTLVRHPGNADALRRTAWIRATSPDPELRDPAQALRIARDLSARSDAPLPGDLELLAATLAAAGHPAEASATVERAANRAAELGFPDLAGEIRGRAAVYLRAPSAAQP